MKFYTRKQLLLTVAVCFLTGAIVAGSFRSFFGKENNQGERDESAVTALISEAADTSSHDFGWVETLPGQSEAAAVEISTLSQNAALEDERNSIAIYDRYNSAVVNISTEVIGYNWLFEPIPREGSSGSGAVISEDGYILTNTHVVAKAYKVYVTLSDGDSYEGTIVGLDPENDLAVLKIDAKDKKLTVIPFGSSDALEVGQKVLAIGNPFGYDRTLTQGIISGVSRPVRSGNNLIIKNMIQTDASINPGNSGGPLLNSAGELIGINTIIYSPSGGSVGIGFAVPVDTARRVIPDLIRYGKVNRGWIDIVPVQINSRIAHYAQLPVSSGILISEIPAQSTAGEAGLKGGDKRRPIRYGNSFIYFGGDIITAVGETPVHTFGDLLGALEETRPGDQVAVTIVRGKEEKTVMVTLSERTFSIK